MKFKRKLLPYAPDALSYEKPLSKINPPLPMVSLTEIQGDSNFAYRETYEQGDWEREANMVYFDTPSDIVPPAQKGTQTERYLLLRQKLLAPN